MDTQDTQTQEAGDITDDIRAAAESLSQGTAPEIESVEQPPPETTETAEVKAERARDEAGRFAKADKDPTKAQTPDGATADVGRAKAAGEGKPAPTGPAAAPASQTPIADAAEAIKETMKPPASWKPLAREKWGALPPEVQQEVIRVDREIQSVMRESAEARKGYQSFRDTVAPFEAMIRAEGSEPIGAVKNLLETAAALRTAAPGFKAKLAADMIKKFHIPIEDLDKELAGEGGAQAQAPAQYRDPRLDGLLAQIEQGKRQRAEREQAKIAREIEDFASKHEFFEDLREEMGLLIDAAHQRGREMTLDQAYKIAAASNDEISKVIKQREGQKSAANASASMQRAKVAGSSPKSSPAPAPAGNGAKSNGSLVDDMKASMAAHGMRIPDGW